MASELVDGTKVEEWEVETGPGSRDHPVPENPVRDTPEHRSGPMT
jgi:hypothetical protein